MIELLREHGPMTDEELNAAARAAGYKISNTGMAPARCMMTPPRGKGIIDSGVKRRNVSGRWAVVWTLYGVPEIEPKAIRELRDSQRVVYDLFKKYGEMTHAVLFERYFDEVPADAEIMSDSSVRSRCSELVALKLVEKKRETAHGVAVWGLV